LSRIAAVGLFVIFIGALIVPSRDGWMMNWYGRKNGEGIEYLVLLASLLLLICEGELVLFPLIKDAWNAVTTHSPGLSI
jgi:hypothetical protein